jgi:hypothetical protein
LTREEAEAVLAQAGQGADEAFPLLDCAIACAIHDYPFRDADCVRILADHAAQRLKERAANESPDDALTEALAGDLRLNGDLLNYDHPANTDVIDVAERRRGLSAVLVIFYLDAARRAGLTAAPVDFPGHVLLRVETPEGPVALDPFSQGRLVLPSELTRRALLAGPDPACGRPSGPADGAGQRASGLDPSAEHPVHPRHSGSRLLKAPNARPCVAPCWTPRITALGWTWPPPARSRARLTGAMQALVARPQPWASRSPPATRGWTGCGCG